MTHRADQLIVDAISSDDRVRLANGMLAPRVNADWIHHSQQACEVLSKAAKGFRELVAGVLPGAVGYFVLNGGRKLSCVFPDVRAGVNKLGEIEGDLPPYGQVYLIEDVLTTGGSAVRAVDALRERGIMVEFLFALADRGVGAVQRLRRHGVNVVNVVEVKAYHER